MIALLSRLFEISDQEKSSEVAKPTRHHPAIEDGFIAQEKRAQHWENVFADFWTRQRSWL